MVEEVSAVVVAAALVEEEVVADPAVDAVVLAVAADMVGLVKAVPAAEAPEDARVASGNIFARRRFADSASTKWISSITRRPTCCSSLCRSAANFCLAG